MLRAIVATTIVATSLILGTVTTAHASAEDTTRPQTLLEDTAPTFENGSVDPALTADPPAVAAAQKALAEFFEYTNREYSPAGFANPRQMREELGNQASHWLDKTMPLACGRLINGYKGRNWIPGKGWAHEAPPAHDGAPSFSCQFRPPSAGDGGPIPEETIDPPAVAAAQEALASFYRFTNDNYSIRGYANPHLMREELGNEAGRWLDQALALARGDFLCGFRCMNWIPNKGWAHEAPPVMPVTTSPPVATHQSPNAATWSQDMRGMIGNTEAVLVPQPNIQTSAPRSADPVVARIIASFQLPLQVDK